MLCRRHRNPCLLVQPLDQQAVVGMNDRAAARRMDHRRRFLDPVERFHLGAPAIGPGRDARSEEHTSELQSLMRISYAVFCLKKKITIANNRIADKSINNTKKIEKKEATRSIIESRMRQT